MTAIAAPTERSGDQAVRERLAAAVTVKAACAAVVAELSADRALMPSIYLVRGGRLRCRAVARYLAGV